jgi:hypothetical protein
VVAVALRADLIAAAGTAESHGILGIPGNPLVNIKKNAKGDVRHPEEGIILYFYIPNI